MSDNKSYGALAALMSAAAALPIVAVPVSAGAQVMQDEWMPAWLPIGGAAGFRTLYYRESQNRMRVTEPMFWLRAPVGDGWELGASILMDAVSGASPEIVSNRGGSPRQILTGASITERRTAGDAFIKKRVGEGTLSITRTQSSEKDYVSNATGVQASRDFNERNTTLTLGYGTANDRVGSTLDPSLRERRDTREYLFGVTQLIDRHSLLQTNLVFTHGRGYLSDPYRLTQSLVRTGNTQSLLLVPDARPPSRKQWAWLTRWRHHLPATRSVAAAEYRYYRDDWGIRAHTLSMSWLQAVNDRWKIEAGLRYYVQGRADFYRAEITAQPAPQYTSSEQRLAAYGAIEPSLKAILQLTPGCAIDAGVAVYRQQGNWKPGGGTSTFEPLQALKINIGFVQRF